MSKKSPKKNKRIFPPEVNAPTKASRIISKSPEISKVGNSTMPIKYLSSKSIQLREDNAPILTHDLLVPPTTPKNLIPDNEVAVVPHQLPKLVEIPWVREIGVKETIKKLSEIYGCQQFHWNLVQFWFLDFVTDCLWRVQDEYQFPEEHQKVVLDWTIYAFNLIRAGDLNLSRVQILTAFNEALEAAEHHVETGAFSIPQPEELFDLKAGLEPPTETDASESEDTSSVATTFDQNVEDSYIGIQFEDGIKFYDLPQKICHWDTDDDDYLSSSIETISEDEIIVVHEEVVEEEAENVDLMYEDFYKPDLRTPPRFKESTECTAEDSISVSLSEEGSQYEEIEEEENLDGNAPNWFISKKKYLEAPCPSKVDEDPTDRNSDKDEKTKEEELLQSWFDYHLWQLRKADMDDPAIGWLDPSDLNSVTVVEIPETPQNESEEAQLQLYKYLSTAGEDIKQLKRNQFINTCVIMAIKQIMHEYFFDSFQFSIMRMAYRYPHYLITQELNDYWCIPKKFKGEIKRPKPKKMKKKKEPKKVKEKKKGSKKSKSKSSKKSSKKSKSSKSKSSKKSKKSDKKKKKALTKEEKAEIARFKAEMKIREEMERRAAENRHFMFPLIDATEDSFFEKLFTGWVKPRKKGGKKEKEKKGKKKTKK